LQLRSIPSRFALVAGYAAHCEAFEAERLREMCDSDGKHAERLLTMDFMRYLSAEGVSALSDARPAVLRRSAPVQIRQSGRADPASLCADLGQLEPAAQAAPGRRGVPGRVP
jgi:hypothetical protein